MGFDPPASFGSLETPFHGPSMIQSGSPSPRGQIKEDFLFNCCFFSQDQSLGPWQAPVIQLEKSSFLAGLLHEVPDKLRLVAVDHLVSRPGATSPMEPEA